MPDGNGRDEVEARPASCRGPTPLRRASAEGSDQSHQSSLLSQARRWTRSQGRPWRRDGRCGCRRAVPSSYMDAGLPPTRQLDGASDGAFATALSSARPSSSKSSAGALERSANRPPHARTDRCQAPVAWLLLRVSTSSPITGRRVRLMPHQQGAPPLSPRPHRVHLTCASVVILFKTVALHHQARACAGNRFSLCLFIYRVSARALAFPSLVSVLPT